MTNKQQGWNDALDIVIEQFRGFAWQKDLAQERELAAANMDGSSTNAWDSPQEYQQTMFGVVKPFCKNVQRRKSTIQHCASRSL